MTRKSKYENSLRPTRKSKYDLEPFAILKLPKDFLVRFRAISGDRWSELARDVLQTYLDEVEKQ